MSLLHPIHPPMYFFLFNFLKWNVPEVNSSCPLCLSKFINNTVEDKIRKQRGRKMQNNRFHLEQLFYRGNEEKPLFFFLCYIVVVVPYLINVKNRKVWRKKKGKNKKTKNENLFVFVSSLFFGFPSRFFFWTFLFLETNRPRVLNPNPKLHCKYITIHNVTLKDFHDVFVLSCNTYIITIISEQLHINIYIYIYVTCPVYHHIV